MSIIVSALYSYPVKSLRGHTQQRATVTAWGPDGDRRWMLVDELGQFVTQRQLPEMCRIGAVYRGDGVYLWHLSNPRVDIHVSTASAQTPCNVTVWEDRCTALDAGDAAAAWLSHQLGRPLRLCFIPDSSHRQVSRQFAEDGDRLGFADGFPFLLCNEASLQHLSSALGRDLEMQRFRPNIVISGAPPFAEDRWRRILIAGVEFDLVKPCARCAIPTVNLADASREPDVFRVLKNHRQRDGEVFFGQNMIHRSQGQIQLGDAVAVLAMT